MVEETNEEGPKPDEQKSEHRREGKGGETEITEELIEEMPAYFLLFSSRCGLERERVIFTKYDWLLSL